MRLAAPAYSAGNRLPLKSIAAFSAGNDAREQIPVVVLSGTSHDALFFNMHFYDLLHFMELFLADNSFMMPGNKVAVGFTVIAMSLKSAVGVGLLKHCCTIVFLVRENTLNC